MLLLRFRASCDEAANGVGILVLVNVVDHCVHNRLALVSKIRQLGTKLNGRKDNFSVSLKEILKDKSKDCNLMHDAP